MIAPKDKAPLHLVSAFATTSRLVLGQEAVEGKSQRAVGDSRHCSTGSPKTAD